MLKAGAALGAGAVVMSATRSLGAAQTPGASPAAGGWTFTDDRGVTVSLPEAPTRVIAQTSSAASLWDFGFDVVGFFGPNDPDNAAGFPQVGDMAVDRLTNVGDYGAFDLEAAIALDADLYVDLDRGGETLWYLDADTQAAIERVIPTVGINADGVSVIDIVARYEDLAVALGVDAESETITAAKAQHTASEEAFRTSLAATGGLKVLTVSSGTDGTIYLWNPNWLPDLIYFTSLGFTGVEVGVEDTVPNLVVSAETVAEYEADVILVDARGDLADLEGNPLWEALPAVKAGQVGYWYASFPYSYQKLAEVLDLTAETLAKATPIV